MADLVPPATLSGTARPLLAEDIGIAALPTAPYESSLRSLCKPAFSEFESGLFMCGTEDQTNPGGNQLIVGSINFETKRTLHTEEGKPCIWTQAVPDHVRDVSWVVPSHAVAAFGSRLALIRVLGPVTERPKFDIIQFPVQHTDLVRELAPCPQAKFTVASCGFDGKVFVTDLVKTATSAQGGAAFEVGLYDCGEPSSSVSWRPDDSNAVTATTDNGTCHVFDIRTELRRPSIRIGTETPNLFSHTFTSPYRLLFGYGDGSLQLHDIRKPGVMLTIQDPYQSAIGDVRCQPNGTGLTVVTCGHPGLSVWGYTLVKDKPELRVASHHRAAGIDFATKPHYKIAGGFVPGTKLFAATDSLGSMLVLDTTEVY